MQADSHDNLAEAPAVGDMQPIALTGRRPTLDRLRVEAAEAATRQRRQKLLTRAALAVVGVSLIAIAIALLAGR